MAPFLRIKLVGAGSFVKVDTFPEDDVFDVGNRACKEYKSWEVDAAQISLYLVAEGGDEEPSDDAINAVLSKDGHLGTGWVLTQRNIKPGAWLVALKKSKGEQKVGKAADWIFFLSPDIICCLPLSYGMWLDHWKQRAAGSLWLFCMWEVVSALLDNEWKVLGFTILGAVVFNTLLVRHADEPWTSVPLSLLAHSLLVWGMWKAGVFPKMISW